MMVLILMLGALLGFVVAIAGMVLIVAADPLWGSVSLAIAALIMWWILRGLLRWFRRFAAEYERQRAQNPLPRSIWRQR